MARTTLNEMTEARTLSADEQKTLNGGLFFGFNPWAPYFTPSFGYNPYSSPYASGYGMFRNTFQPNTFGFGVQAATFSRMATADAGHNSFLARLRA